MKDASWFSKTTGCCPEPMKTRSYLRLLAIIIIIIIIIIIENSKQEDKLVLENPSKEFLRRLAIIWSNPL